MVGTCKVIVDSFRNADYAHIIVDGCDVFAELHNRVHRIVTADIEEVTDIVLLKNINDILKCYGGFFGIWSFFAAGAECRRGCVLEVGEMLFGCEDLAKVDKPFFTKTFDAVSHTVYFADKSFFDSCKSTADNTRKGSVDC